MRSGRFQKDPSKKLQDFGQSVTYDWRLFQQDIRGSIAHARALRNAGILTEEEFLRITRGLEQIRQEIEDGHFTFSTALEDVHMNIEAELTRRIGPTGAKLHTARSRNDQVATDLRMYLREELLLVRGEVRELQQAMLGLGLRYPHTLIPGYTHLQRAQPVPFCHHLLAYVEMLERDSQRLADAVERMNFCPLGSGALAGSTLVLNREAIAKELGFAGPTQNSMDAVADRDFACEILAALAILGMHLSRLCEDIILWCSTEFGFLRLSDAHTTGSSLMPQKKNPDIAELTRGKSGRLLGNFVALLTTCKGLPLTYNRDLQEDKEPLFDSLDTVKACLPLLAEMLTAAEVDEAAAGEAVADPLLLATDLADLLVRRGVPFRQAHDQVGKLVACAEKAKLPLSKLPRAVVQEIAPLALPGFEEVFHLQHAMEARQAIGCPAPARVEERLAWWRRHFAQNPLGTQPTV